MKTILGPYRAIKRQFPDKKVRKLLVEQRGGVATLFIYKPQRGAWEVNSIEFTIRCMAIKSGRTA